MSQRMRRKNTRRCARAPGRFYPAPVFPLRARAAFHNGKSKTDRRKNDPDKKMMPPVKKWKTSCAGGSLCLLILPALGSMARGELLRSRSLKRPPLANVQERLRDNQQKNLPGSGRLATVWCIFNRWEAVLHGTDTASLV